MAIASAPGRGAAAGRGTNSASVANSGRGTNTSSGTTAAPGSTATTAATSVRTSVRADRRSDSPHGANPAGTQDGSANGAGSLAGAGNSAADIPQDDDATIARAGTSVAFATLLSRITGFIRNLLIGSTLGAGVASAFTSANTLPNLITEVVLGAVLTSLVIPVLTRAEKEDPDRGAAFIRRLFTVATTLLLVVTIVAVMAAPWLVRLSLDDSGKVNMHMAVLFAYLLLPQILFYGLFSLLQAVLNTKNVFGPSAWAPVVNNLIVLVVFALYWFIPGALDPQQKVSITEPHVLLLGAGTTFGVVVQALMLVPSLRQLNVDLRPLWGIDARLKRFANQGAAIVLYVVISQIGFFITNRIASVADEGAVFIYQQQWLLLQVPYGVIGVTLLTVIMPRMSRNAADGDNRAVVNDLTKATILTLIALIPIIVFFTVFGTTISHALFQWGRFDPTQADILGEALSFGAFTLVPYAIVLLHLRVFYAREQAWTPTYIILGITITKIVLSLMAPHWASDPKFVVVLLSATNGFGFLTGAIVGVILLRRSLGSLNGRRVWTASLWALGAALIGAVAAWVVDFIIAGQWLGWFTDAHGWGQLFGLVDGSAGHHGAAADAARSAADAAGAAGSAGDAAGTAGAAADASGAAAAAADAANSAGSGAAGGAGAGAGAGATAGAATATAVNGWANLLLKFGALARLAVDGIVLVVVTGLVLARSHVEEIVDFGRLLSRIPGVRKFIKVAPAHEIPILTLDPQVDTYTTFGEMQASPALPPMSGGVVRGPRLVPGAAVAQGRYRLLADCGGTAAMRLWQAREQATGDIVALTIIDATKVAARTERMAGASSPLQDGDSRAQSSDIARSQSSETLGSESPETSRSRWSERSRSESFDGTRGRLADTAAQPSESFAEGAAHTEPTSATDPVALHALCDDIIARTLATKAIDSYGMSPVSAIVREATSVMIVAPWVQGSSLRAVAATQPNPLAAAHSVADLADAVRQANDADVVIGIDHRDRLRITTDGRTVVAFPGVLPHNSAHQDVHGVGVVLALLLEKVDSSAIPAPVRELMAALRGLTAAELDAAYEQLRSVGGGQATTVDTGASTRGNAGNGADSDGSAGYVRGRDGASTSEPGVGDADGTSGSASGRLAGSGYSAGSASAGMQGDDQPIAGTPVTITAGRGRVMRPEDDATPSPQMRPGFGEAPASRARLIAIGVVTVLAVLAAALAITYVLGRVDRSNGPVRSDVGTTATSTTPAPEPARAADAAYWMPENGRGTPDNPDQVSLIVDGSEATGWYSDIYRTQLGPSATSVKAGLGLMVTLAQVSDLTAVQIHGGLEGMHVEIRTAPSATPASLDDTTVVGTADLENGTTNIPVTSNNGPVSTGCVLLWITSVPLPDAARVTEVTFTGSAALQTSEVGEAPGSAAASTSA
ncbi:MAG: murein biosynthesis integral membrane protein MurJ [Bifidobacterium sp.]|nr:murein biosynthesis integral membrane protein MurJ [Bifidobacterium sp.]